MVDNPFKNLPKPALISIVIGGVGITGFALFQHHKSTGSWSPFATSTATPTPGADDTSSTSDTVTDPTTGQTFPANGLDAVSGLEYSQDISQYGSVAAADAAVSEFGGEAGSSDGLGNSDLSGGYYTTPYNTGSFGSSTTVSGSVYTSNSAWAQAATAGLEDISGSSTYDGTDIASALGTYLQGEPLTSGQAVVVNAAIGEYGQPPVGNLQVTLAPSVSPTSTPTAPAPATGTISVPNVVGRTDLDTAKSIITSAGLKAVAAGDTGAGNTGSVTSQSPVAGTKVTKGSSVTLTYTANTADNSKVAVPNEVGRTDLSTAQSDLAKAGLKSKVTGNTSLAKGNKGKVTKTSPAAGTKVSKGTVVTITYN